ncbi:MAG TPA: YidB family protein [Candidatus Limnocylindrales bacterium]
MDLNQVMQLANNPQVRQLIQGLLQQFMSGQGGQGGQANGQALLNQLQQAGLGDQVQSWLSGGPNQAVTGAQLQQALGPGLDQAAAAAGLPPQEAANDLAEVVPAVVNEASPNGQLDMNALQDILKKLSAPAG